MNKYIYFLILLFVHTFGLAQFSSSTQGCLVSVDKPTPETEIIWTGGCKEGLAAGRGKLVWFEGNKFVAAYSGEMASGKWEGNGTATFSSGDIYEGDFRNDILNGQGIHTSNDGSAYVGQFTNFKYNGVGTYTARKSKFVGRLWVTEGEILVGEWIDGILNGRGIQYRADGKVLESGIYGDGRQLRAEYVDPKVFGIEILKKKQ